MKIAVFTEFGGNIGFGHLSRTSAIADRFALKEVETHFYIYNPEKQAPLASQLNHDFTLLNWTEEIPEIKCDIALVDSYLARESVYSELKKKVKYLVVIDDYNRITYDADLIVNPNTSFEKVDYSNQHSAVIGGNQYVLLRLEITEFDFEREINGSVENVLVTVGGSDYKGLLKKLLLKIPIEFPKSTFNFLCVNEDKVNELLEFKPVNANLLGYKNASEMAELMNTANIAVTAAGQILGELAFAGTPFIPFCLDVDQEPNLEFYRAQNIFSESIHSDDSNFESKIILALKDHLDSNIREQKANKLRKLIDGTGAERIVDYIIEDVRKL